MSSGAKPIVSPEGQSATFVELFFDLVFVFSVTQLVGLLHHEFSWKGAGQTVLVFWLVWWAWTQFTWALNAANTEHHHIQFWTLTATGAAFFMAAALPDAFHGGALSFAVPYVAVRVIGLRIYAWVASADEEQSSAVRLFSVLSLGGIAAVLAGAVAGPGGQYWLWGLAMASDVGAALVAGRADAWGLHAEHFGERHGLFVIIALGETLIVAAGSLAGTVWTETTIGVGILAVGVACALWWTYFPKSKPKLEAALASQSNSAQAAMARDVYSFMHFPMLCGVISYAVAIESIAAHPNEPLSLGGRLALAAGLVLFVGGMAGAMLRATCGLLIPRVLIVLVTCGVIAAWSGAPPAASLALAFAGVTAVAVVEQRRS